MPTPTPLVPRERSLGALLLLLLFSVHCYAIGAILILSKLAFHSERDAESAARIHHDYPLSVLTMQSPEEGHRIGGLFEVIFRHLLNDCIQSIFARILGLFGVYFANHRVILLA